ncbi:hypothetical protein J1614_010650 [Plenodomus biglobosus]|nr:hypothetical protein J1614_010650 [Plenodomus biglobosus]
MKHASISPQLQPKWTRQAVEALTFIHLKEVIHCDIHPRNFLLDAELNVQLCDFAGSLFGSLDGGEMESTRYFLPRAWQDTPNVISDLFAFTSFMFLFMTGREPYQDLSDEEVTRRFKQQVFPDVGDFQFARTIKGCWAGDFKSPEDMLGAVLGDEFVVT